LLYPAHLFLLEAVKIASMKKKAIAGQDGARQAGQG